MTTQNAKDLKDKDTSHEISMLYNLSEMAQSVAYEINNPLMIIDGYSKKIKKNHAKAEYSDLIKDIDAIKKSSLRINSIVSDLLTYSKENLKLPLEDVSFLDLAKKSILVVKENLPKLSANIVIDEITDEKVKVNISLCTQAIVNILTEALVHASKTTEPQISLSFRQMGEVIELVIKDNGEKLSEEFQARMFFETFSKNLDSGRLGMGMNSSFNMAKKFSGHLYFDNSYSENAFVFSFNLQK